ncbi:hypothetical protein VT85_10790 [Planctomyces sp. SH-PL62]|nr:hypothetical protein VT85_10790 [Planctomyces sp. SH-PL62]
MGSIAMTGMPSIAASSNIATQSPVLPLPVIPTQTACVVSCFESYNRRPDVASRSFTSYSLPR